MDGVFGVDPSTTTVSTTPTLTYARTVAPQNVTPPTKRSEDWPNTVASASAAPSADVAAAENWTGDRASQHFKRSND